MVKKAIDSGKARLGESGRLLVRRSATAPVVRVMAEGDDEVLVRQVVGDVTAALQSASKLVNSGGKRTRSHRDAVQRVH